MMRTLRLLFAATLTLALFAAPAHASRHGAGPSWQHWLADTTGLDWLHPAPPVPSHGQHLGWRQMVPDIKKLALDDYRHDPRVSALLTGLEHHLQAVRTEGAEVYTDPAQPQHASIHRLHETAAALLMRLSWLGRNDPKVASLTATVEAVLALYDADSLCGNEAARTGSASSPDAPQASLKRLPPWQALVTGLGLLALFGFARARGLGLYRKHA